MSYWRKKLGADNGGQLPNGGKSDWLRRLQIIKGLIKSEEGEPAYYEELANKITWAPNYPDPTNLILRLEPLHQQLLSILGSLREDVLPRMTRAVEATGNEMSIYAHRELAHSLLENITIANIRALNAIELLRLMSPNRMSK